MIALALRRERLPLSIRGALFEKLSSHLRARLSLSKPAYFSEEKFVLNLTAAALSAQVQEPAERRARIK